MKADVTARSVKWAGMEAQEVTIAAKISGVQVPDGLCLFYGKLTRPGRWSQVHRHPAGRAIVSSPNCIATMSRFTDRGDFKKYFCKRNARSLERAEAMTHLNTGLDPPEFRTQLCVT